MPAGNVVRLLSVSVSCVSAASSSKTSAFNDVRLLVVRVRSVSAVSSSKMPAGNVVASVPKFNVVSPVRPSKSPAFRLAYRNRVVMASSWATVRSPQWKTPAVE